MSTHSVQCPDCSAWREVSLARYKNICRRQKPPYCLSCASKRRKNEGLRPRASVPKKMTFRCPDCDQERFVGRCAFLEIKSGKRSGRCRACARRHAWATKKDWGSAWPTERRKLVSWRRGQEMIQNLPPYGLMVALKCPGCERVFCLTNKHIRMRKLQKSSNFCATCAPSHRPTFRHDPNTGDQAAGKISELFKICQE